MLSELGKVPHLFPEVFHEVDHFLGKSGSPAFFRGHPEIFSISVGRLH